MSVFLEWKQQLTAKESECEQLRLTNRCIETENSHLKASGNFNFGLEDTVA